MPQRIQRKRTKGWRMPEDGIYVGRPSKWGNPFAVSRQYDLQFEDGHRLADINSRQDAHAAFIDCLWGDYQCDAFDGYPTMAKIRAELRGRDLACWCPLVDENGMHVPCHADVLLELANRRTV